MFADDVAAIADTVSNLQDHIKRISEFSQATGMKLNLDKSKIVVFRNGGPLRNNEQWFYNGHRVAVVSSYKYLGATFTTKLSWTKTKDSLALQASKAVNCIHRYQHHFGYFPHREAFKLFDSIVKAILTYSSEIWGHQDCPVIERIHTQFCKRLCCLNQNVANYFAISECGRYPISVTYMYRCLKYWTKVISMPSNRYPKQCYVMLRRLDESGRTTWATHIKHLLFRFGFGFVWITNEVGDSVSFLKIFSQRLCDCAKQNTQELISSSPKAKSYKLFKSVLDPETYISLPLPYKITRALYNFRCSSHDLMIEKGRHVNIERNYRYCRYCLSRNVYVVENEVHFCYIVPYTIIFEILIS